MSRQSRGEGGPLGPRGRGDGNDDEQRLDAAAVGQRPRAKGLRIALVNANTGSSLLRLIRGGWLLGGGIITAPEISTLPEQVPELAAQLG